MMLTVLQGDNTQILPTLPAESVQCIVTSPPYFGLRDYGLPPTDWPAVEYAPMAGLEPITIPAMSCCLGLEPTPVAYIGHLVYVWRLLHRVLRADGVCWLNLGDSYAGSGGMEPYRRTSSGKLMPQQGPALAAGLAQKQLIGIPWRVAFALQADGWYLRSDVIWNKPNAMPESVQDRPTKAHEYIFLLAKQERYFYDMNAIREAHSRDWRNETINETQHVVTERKDKGNRQGSGGPAGRNKRSVWTVATSPYTGAHYAVFPEALIEPCILAGSAAQACEVCGAPWLRMVERVAHAVNEKEAQRQQERCDGVITGGTRAVTPSVTARVERSARGFAPSCACAQIGSARSVVLDPYGGSGTTGRVALKHNRAATLIELNQTYVDDNIAERTAVIQPVLPLEAA